MSQVAIFLVIAFIGGLPLLYFAYQKVPTLKSTYVRVDFKKRFFAALIDGFICSLLASPYFYNKKYLFLSIVATSSHLLLKDGLLEGQSVGKFISGLKVIRLSDEKPALLTDSISRNFLFLIPGLNAAAILFECVAMSLDKKGIRLGDKIAGTQVVAGVGGLDSLKELFLSDMQEPKSKKRFLPRSARRDAKKKK